MIIRNADRHKIEVAAQETGVLLRYIKPKGRGWHLTLKPDVQRKPSANGYGRILTSTLYQRKGFWKQHRIDAVCWHGHRDFMRALFRMCPTAVIITSWARYNGVLDFENKFEETGYKNIGSMMQPMYARDACFCG